MLTLPNDAVDVGKGEKKKSKKRKKKLPKLTAEEEAKQKEEKVTRLYYLYFSAALVCTACPKMLTSKAFLHKNMLEMTQLK